MTRSPQDDGSAPLVAWPGRDRGVSDLGRGSGRTHRRHQLRSWETTMSPVPRKKASQMISVYMPGSTRVEADRLAARPANVVVSPRLHSFATADNLHLLALAGDSHVILWRRSAAMHRFSDRFPL